MELKTPKSLLFKPIDRKSFSQEVEIWYVDGLNIVKWDRSRVKIQLRLNGEEGRGVEGPKNAKITPFQANRQKILELGS